MDPRPVWCPQDKDVLMISFRVSPVQLGALPWFEPVLLELEGGILLHGWNVVRRDADKALEEQEDMQAIKIAELEAELNRLQTSLNTPSYEPSSKRPSNGHEANSPRKKGSGGAGEHHMTAQQTSQHMQDTARRALDTYSELMVEHPFQTLKWVESCVESLALLCPGEPTADHLSEQLQEEALAHLHQNLSDAPKALVLRDTVHTARQRCAFFKRECPEDEALHGEMNQELDQAVQRQGVAMCLRTALHTWRSNLRPACQAEQEVMCPRVEETSETSEEELSDGWTRLSHSSAGTGLADVLLASKGAPPETGTAEVIEQGGTPAASGMDALVGSGLGQEPRARTESRDSDHRTSRHDFLSFLPPPGMAQEQELRADREVVLAAVQQRRMAGHWSTPYQRRVRGGLGARKGSEGRAQEETIKRIENTWPAHSSRNLEEAGYIAQLRGYIPRGAKASDQPEALKLAR
eukprot:TRINITY_DN1571_c0_g1_i13.p2 TRINITY_DN1571_c0_g1~~TRINITY_DN1571_c0_g1_i13.p2  ORF type:complete len:465 (-),score=97.87 TRINITY_DN1571_c0_g1_i13:1475-2869(-)